MYTAIYAHLNIIFVCDIVGTILGVNLGRFETLRTVRAKLVVENSIDVGDNT